MAIRFFPAK